MRVTPHISFIISSIKAIIQKINEKTFSFLFEKLFNDDFISEFMNFIEIIILNMKNPILQEREQIQFTHISRLILSSLSSTIRKFKSFSSFSFFFSFLQKRTILNKITENNNNSNGFRNFSNIDFFNLDNNRTFTNQSSNIKNSK